MTEQFTKRSLQEGAFYRYLCKKYTYNELLENCIKRTVDQLMTEHTSENRPGMLLGHVQSGKTRAFLGVVGLAFDQGYDIAIILTKGTNVLVEQTLTRIREDFRAPIVRDALRVYDIMALPQNLSKWELEQKLILVVKKETKNLDRIQDALFIQYPALQKKRILFIDDEADYASVSYVFNKEKNTTEQRVIAGKIDTLRAGLESSSYLQVTATPYSLYLQPEELPIQEGIRKFQPIRPAFTELVPVHDRYVGGDFYFKQAEDARSIAGHMYGEITENDLTIMKSADFRRVDRVDLLGQRNTKQISSAIVNFIVGSCLRRWQQTQQEKRPEKYAMIIHTERGKAAHEWQQDLIYLIIQELTQKMTTDRDVFEAVIRVAYLDLYASAELIPGATLPTYEELLREVERALVEEMVIATVVNSNQDVMELLDDVSGQLRLRTPMNIFIGGQILDRGITIQNLIGFFYGRNPRTAQQDTVLQHARMYGARTIENLAVTRFYTTARLYEMMKNIHEFDEELRTAFEKGGHEQGVVFIRQDETRDVTLCSPNKIMLSELMTLRPHKRMLPVGFQTGYKTYIQKQVREIEHVLDKLIEAAVDQNGQAYLVPLNKIETVLELIDETLEMEAGHTWHVHEWIAILRYLLMDEREKSVWIIIRHDRKISRFNQKGMFENAPDTASGPKSELRIARHVAETKPALIFLKQKGEVAQGWRGTPFWWPILIMPKQTKATVFAREVYDG